MDTAIRMIVDEDGQDLIEYALLVALVALLCIAAIGTAGENIATFFWQAVADRLSAVAS